MSSLRPISPSQFFSFSLECHQGNEKKGFSLGSKFLLPDLSTLFFDEPPFATLSMAWTQEGIRLFFKSQIAFSASRWPEFREGDSLEIFFDTRDVKTGSGTSRFCHHFCVFGTELEVNEESVNGIELTRFRGEDVHDLADPSKIFVKREKKWRGMEMEIFFPKEILHGYDPLQFDRLGFTYRINRAYGLPQYFSISGDEVAIENHPALWASLKLMREGK